MFARKAVAMLLGHTRSRTLVPLVETTRSLPVCCVQTNLSDEQIPTDFTKGLSQVLASTLNKQERVISVSLTPSVRICRSGDDQPTAIVQVWSIGVFDATRNPKYTVDIYDYILKALPSVPSERIVLLLHPLKPEEAGHLIYEKLKDSSATKH